MIIRGTTPTFKLSLPASVDLTKANNIYVSFSQQSVKIVKSGEDLEVSAHEVDVYLTQEESLKFVCYTYDGKSNPVDIQLNWTYDDGSRACSTIVSVNVGRNLIGKVLD